MRALTLGFLILWVHVSDAATVQSMTLEEALAASDGVAVIRIVKAEVNEFCWRETSKVCGISYKAEIREPIKAIEDEETILFQSEMQLQVDTKYLMFFNQIKSQGPDGREEVISEPDYLGSNEYERCVSRLPSNWYGGPAIRFSNAPTTYREQWLIAENLSPILPDEIEVRKAECVSDDAPECDRVSQPALIRWSSLKRFLLEK